MEAVVEEEAADRRERPRRVEFQLGLADAVHRPALPLEALLVRQARQVVLPACPPRRLAHDREARGGAAQVFAQRLARGGVALALELRAEFVEPAQQRDLDGLAAAAAARGRELGR